VVEVKVTVPLPLVIASCTLVVVASVVELPKPPTEMTIVNLSYINLSYLVTQFYISILNVRSKSDCTASQINFKVNVVSLLPGMRRL
jgi:hypothetical protein